MIDPAIRAVPSLTEGFLPPESSNVLIGIIRRVIDAILRDKLDAVHSKLEMVCLDLNAFSEKLKNVSFDVSASARMVNALSFAAGPASKQELRAETIMELHTVNAFLTPQLLSSFIFCA